MSVATRILQTYTPHTPKLSNLPTWLRWVSLLRVTGQGGGAGCARLRADANAAVVVVTAACLT